MSDRAGLIELLNRLGSDDDAAVLEAARALHRKAAESGLSWDDLIRPDRTRTSDEPTRRSAGRRPDRPDAAETTRLIERLLRKGVSDNLREDLIEMKRQLADGALDQDDGATSARSRGASAFDRSVLLRLEIHRHAVDAVAQAGRRRAVGKHVTEMAAAAAAMHLGADHAVAAVLRGLDRARRPDR